MYNVENCIDNVRNILTDLRDNHRKLATTLNCKCSTLSMKIYGERPIDLALALKVADYKGISLHDLVTNNPNPHEKTVPYMIDFQNGTTIDSSDITFQKIHDYWQEVKTDYYLGTPEDINYDYEESRNSTTLYRYKNADKAYLKKNLRLDTYLDLCNYLCKKCHYSPSDLL